MFNFLKKRLADKQENDLTYIGRHITTKKYTITDPKNRIYEYVGRWDRKHNDFTEKEKKFIRKEQNRLNAISTKPVETSVDTTTTQETIDATLSQPMSVTDTPTETKVNKKISTNQNTVSKETVIDNASDETLKNLVPATSQGIVSTSPVQNVQQPKTQQKPVYKKIVNERKAPDNWSGYTFSDAEKAKLENGEEIYVQGAYSTHKRKNFNCNVILGQTKQKTWKIFPEFDKRYNTVLQELIKQSSGRPAKTNEYRVFKICLPNEKYGISSTTRTNCSIENIIKYNLPPALQNYINDNNIIKDKITGQLLNNNFKTKKDMMIYKKDLIDKAKKDPNYVKYKK